MCRRRAQSGIHLMSDHPTGWLRQAVDCLIDLHDDDPGADIEAIQTKVHDCVTKYEAHYIPFGHHAIEAARTRLAEAFMNWVRDDTPL
jgi:hypothetical protein